MQPLGRRDPKKISEYTLIGRLGSGGMGVVYLASRGSETVALKVVRDALLEDESQIARFRREIATLESISHPNIARILDTGVDVEQAWFAAEFANGPDLSARVKDKGPLGEDEWWTLAKGLMSALAAVHAAGVIHRDVKPSNVILTEAGPKLIDFGIAHVSDVTSVTSTGMVAGSPAWFSPEQIEGLELTPATDVFSAGSVLTLAATGSSPWGDETTMTKASVFKILTNEPNIEGLGGSRGEFVGRLLEKEPSDRPSAEAAAHAATNRDASGLAAGSTLTAETTRVVPRTSVGNATPTFSRPAKQAPQRGGAQTTDPATPSKKRRIGPKTIAALLVPVLAAAGLIITHQSEVTGDMRLKVQVSDKNPIRGTASITLGSGSQNPVELELTEDKTWPSVVKWSSWETLRVVYEPPYSEDEEYSDEIRLSEAGVNGFSSNAQLSYEVVLNEKFAILQLVDRATNSVLHTVRLKRENEEEAFSACFDTTVKRIQREMARHRDLRLDYASMREDTGLNYGGSLLYTTWASRAETLARQMDDRLDLLPTPSEPLVAEKAYEIEEAYAELIAAWRNFASEARSQNGDRFDVAWAKANRAEVDHIRAGSTSNSELARQVCEESVQ